MKRHTWILLGLLLAFSLALAGCGPASTKEPESASSAPEPIRIAVVGPLSGDVKLLGERQRNGALMAIEEWNAKGGVLGRPIEVIIGDSKCDPKEAADVGNKVVFEDKVHYMLGAVCSNASIPISEITNPNHVIQVTWSTNPAVTESDDGTCKDYVFRIAPLDTYMARSDARYVVDELNAKTAAVFYDMGDDFVKGLAEFFRDAFEDLGGEVLVYEAYTKDDTDFSALLTKADNAGVDVVFLPDRYPKANLIGAQAKEIGIEATFFGCDAWQSEELDTDVLDGSYFGTLFSDEAPDAQSFVQAYREKHGKTADMSCAFGYDGIGILLTAIEKAGVDDPEKVKEVLATMEYEGVTGSTRFEGCNNPAKPVFIYRVDKDEGLVFVDMFSP